MLARALTCLLATVPLFFMPAATAAPAFLSVRSGHDQVARWNPCEPIGYRINPAGAPPGAVAEVREAVARISAATSLTFRYEGTTGVTPGPAPIGYPAGTRLIIAWGAPEAGADADVVGLGGAAYAPGRTRDGRAALVIDYGMVLLDAARTTTMARGFGPAPGGTTGRLLLHELGHAVGLAHPAAAGPGEIMYPRLTDAAAEWGTSDRAGLRAVGATGGCLYADPQYSFSPTWSTMTRRDTLSSAK